jgi:para-aminobenzoate synthetase component 1
VLGVPGRPPAWAGPLEEVDRWEWRGTGDPVDGLRGFLAEHGLAAPARAQRGSTAVALLAGAVGCERLAGFAPGRPSPVPAVPELAAVAYRPGGRAPKAAASVSVEGWKPSWSDADHRAAVGRVREAIGRGEVYQVNVVGHRSAPHRSDPADVARPSPRCRVRATPGCSPARAGPSAARRPSSSCAWRGAHHDRAGEGHPPHRPGQRAGAARQREGPRRARDDRRPRAQRPVAGRRHRQRRVESLYDVRPWSGLWHAGSLVAATLSPDATTVDVPARPAAGRLGDRAPKRAACALLDRLEPVGPRSGDGSARTGLARRLGPRAHDPDGGRRRRAGAPLGRGASPGAATPAEVARRTQGRPGVPPCRRRSSRCGPVLLRPLRAGLPPSTRPQDSVAAAS